MVVGVRLVVDRTGLREYRAFMMAGAQTSKTLENMGVCKKIHLKAHIK